MKYVLIIAIFGVTTGGVHCSSECGRARHEAILHFLAHLSTQRRPAHFSLCYAVMSVLCLSYLSSIGILYRHLHLRAGLAILWCFVTFGSGHVQFPVENLAPSLARDTFVFLRFTSFCHSFLTVHFLAHWCHIGGRRFLKVFLVTASSGVLRVYI
ncbi:hypothetical protein BDV59DRAFT_10179 [Aspergillus ambiguus]|uniref:uncharacterized protein n=1 Tax=Aspergillus ambiguus TaxID=176160 RepID=UPI003CCDF32C